MITKYRQEQSTSQQHEVERRDETSCGFRRFTVLAKDILDI